MGIRADSDQVEELFDNLGMPMGERRDAGRAAGEEHRASFVEPYADWRPGGLRFQHFREPAGATEEPVAAGSKPLERLAPAIEHCSRCGKRNLKGAIGVMADPRKLGFFMCPACARKADKLRASLVMPVGGEAEELEELTRPPRPPGRPRGSKTKQRWVAKPFVPKSREEGG